MAIRFQVSCALRVEALNSDVSMRSSLGKQAKDQLIKQTKLQLEAAGKSTRKEFGLGNKKATAFFFRKR